MTMDEAAIELAEELDAALKKLAASVPKIQKKITNMAENSTAALGTLHRGVNSLRSGFLKLSVGIAGTAGASGLFLGNMDSHAKALQDLAKQTSMSTDEIQQWQYAAKATGSDSSAVISDLEKLRASFMETGMSAGEAAQAAQDQFMGIAKSMEGQNWDQALAIGAKEGISEDTIRLLQRGVDGVKKLHEEAKNMGLVIPSKDLQSFRTMNRDAGILADSLRNLGGDALAALAPKFKELVDWFKKWNAQNREWLSGKIKETVVGIAEGFQRFLDIAKQIKAKALDPLMKALDPLMSKLAENKGFLSDFVASTLTGLMVVLAPIAAKLALVVGAFTLLGEAARYIFSAFGDGNSVLGRFAEAVKKIYTENSELFKMIGLVTGTFVTLLVAAGPVTSILASIGAALQTLFTNFTYVGGAFKLLGSIIAANPILIIIVALITALGVLIANLDAVKKKVTDFFTSSLPKWLGWLGKKLFSDDYDEGNYPPPPKAKEEKPTQPNDAELRGENTYGRVLNDPVTALASLNTVPLPGPTANNSSMEMNDNKNVTINQYITSGDPAAVAQATTQGIPTFPNYPASVVVG